MDDIIKIVQSLEKLSLLINGATETVKDRIKKQKSGFFPAMLGPIAVSVLPLMSASLMQTVASSLINSVTGKGIMRAGKGQKKWISSIISSIFIDKGHFWKRIHG